MLQFITHENERHDTLSGATEALRGGCRWIQLRMKDAPEEEILRTGMRLRALCDRYGAKLIVDDHVELVESIGAEGVHLGKHDMAPDEARKLLGPGRIIGGTANTAEDIERLVRLGVDYIGLGPYRFTETKKNLSPVLGEEGYRHILSWCRERGYTLPVVAIGGIELDDIAPLMRCGIAGVALSGMLLRAADTAARTREVLRIIDETKI